MSRHIRFTTYALAIFTGTAITGSLGAQSPARPPMDAAWDSVGRILQTPPAPNAGYVRFNFPRRDISLTLGGVQVAPALALGAWAGFSGSVSNATMMGDLVVLAGELKPVLAEFAHQHIGVTAIHNHLAGEAPTITYVHFHAMGDALTLAGRLNDVLAKTSTPRPVVASTQPVTADTARVFKALGAQGRASGNVVQLSFMLVSEPVTMHGASLTPALAYGTPINLQFVSDNRLVATGDFSVLGAKVDGVLTALATNGITATAVHSHLVGETPHIYYVHFWADGSVDDVLRGLRAAVDAGR
ncbi:MAG: DUF1259 domain-containing protein [Gemmatimonadaceae bacterium]